MTAESMSTICRLSAHLAGYHPLSSKSPARGHVSRDSRAGAVPPHTTHARRDRGTYTFRHQGCSSAPFTPRRPVNAETQNKRKTLLLYILCRAVWTVVYLYGAEDAGLV
eukprot:scaffold104279_cov33-Phaeocystis_antarctica.AAC.1